MTCLLANRKIDLDRPPATAGSIWRSRNSGRNPARHSPLWPGVLETMDRLSRPQSDRGPHALPEDIWRTHQRKRPRPTIRRYSNPHRSDEPLLGPRNGRDHSRGMNSIEKREFTPRASGLQHRPSNGNLQSKADMALSLEKRKVCLRRTSLHAATRTLG